MTLDSTLSQLPINTMNVTHNRLVKLCGNLDARLTNRPDSLVENNVGILNNLLHDILIRRAEENIAKLPVNQRKANNSHALDNRDFSRKLRSKNNNLHFSS